MISSAKPVDRLEINSQECFLVNPLPKLLKSFWFVEQNVILRQNQVTWIFLVHMIHRWANQGHHGPFVNIIIIISGKFTLTVLPKISTKGLTPDNVAELTEKVRDQMLDVFNKTSYEATQSKLASKMTNGTNKWQ